ncbi:MAG: histidine--tRNA ligase [Thermodesulfobacteriota bacterium]
MEFTAIKGFKDILPEEVGPWQRVEHTARAVFRAFGFQEIRTPLLEVTELFSRSIGEETDIVSKEMYTLSDSKGKGLTLRPEATASILRAYIQHRLYQNQPISKLYTIGPMFRHERPQKGRFRQFHQLDAEILGDPGPKSDAEIILLAMELFRALGLSGPVLRVNSLGCPVCRPRFREELKDYLRQKTALLCPDCRRRSETNPLRVFDCKVETCRSVVADAPAILSFICADCEKHFAEVRALLQASGPTPIVDVRLVRGLDYYSRTTFEIQTDRLGSQNAVVGGGRYDDLIRQLGGPDHPGIGFALGVERLVSLLEEGVERKTEGPDLFLAALGKEAEDRAFEWALELRRAGIRVEMEYASKGLKAQLKTADRLRAAKVLIVGENELSAGKALLRDMAARSQQEVPLEGLVERLKEMLRDSKLETGNLTVS